MSWISLKETLLDWIRSIGGCIDLQVCLANSIFIDLDLLYSDRRLVSFKIKNNCLWCRFDHQIVAKLYLTFRLDSWMLVISNSRHGQATGGCVVSYNYCATDGIFKRTLEPFDVVKNDALFWLNK